MFFVYMNTSWREGRLLKRILYVFVCTHTWYQGFRWDSPVLPVPWGECRSSLSEKGGVLSLGRLSLCSLGPGPLPYTASLQRSPAFCEDLGESGSWCWDCFSQVRVRWLGSQSPDSALSNTSPLILGSGGLQALSWPDGFLSQGSPVISLTLPRL